MLRNIFDIRYLGTLIRSGWTWLVLRLAALVLLLAMIAWGWHQHNIPGVEVRDPLMYTNLTSHLFWVWWLMGIVFLALLCGRLWCAVCPLGWINGLFVRLGLKRELPSWLRNFVPVTLVLVGLQLCVYFFTIHRFPDYTAVLLAVSVLLAAAVGLLFRQRAFCLLLCPAGAVMGLYARVAPLQLRVREKAVCDACESKRCVSAPAEWQKFHAGSMVLYRHRRLDDCPVDLVPADISDSAECTLCMNCVQNCDKDNLKLGSRPWLDDLSGRSLGWSETIFFLVLLGLLVANFSKVYVDLRELLLWLPQSVAVAVGWQEPGYYLLATIWIAIILPVLLMLPAVIVYRLAGISRDSAAGAEPPATQDVPVRRSLLGDIGQLAMPLIPLVLAAHVVLALVKINAKAGYLPFSLADPGGVNSFLAFNVMNTMTPPGVILSLDLLKWLVAAVLAGGALLAIRSSSKMSDTSAQAGYRPASLVGIAVVALICFATVIEWLFVR